MPRNATTDRLGLRWYEWAPPDKEPVRLLSVTTIRKLCGVSLPLVEWQLANVIRVATGTRLTTTVGPRGGVREVLTPDGEFPGEFVRRLLATEGRTSALDELRRWLRAAADEPRDTAALRGTVVHRALELGLKEERVTDDMVRSLFAEERDTAAPTDDDVRFVQNCVRQYWHWRSQFPHVVLAREPQVFNLRLGYAGSADALIWVLPNRSPDVAGWQRRADTGRIDRETIDNFGGTVFLIDYKTSKGLWTEHIIQAHAYLAAEFIGADGVVDERLTDLLTIARRGALVQVRPDGVHLLTFGMRRDVLEAFVGMTRLARLIAENPEPRLLADESLVWHAQDTEESEYLEGNDVGYASTT